LEWSQGFVLIFIGSAGDFQQLIDFRLEVYDSVVDFKNEDSWEFFEIPEFESDVCY